MLAQLARNWWEPAGRGVAAVPFGVLLIAAAGRVRAIGPRARTARRRYVLPS